MSRKPALSVAEGNLRLFFATAARALIGWAAHPCCHPERSKGPASWIFCAKVRHNYGPRDRNGVLEERLRLISPTELIAKEKPTLRH
jgi:hypothetical protein